jgi:hypothetical protein
MRLHADARYYMDPGAFKPIQKLARHKRRNARPKKVQK